jgi:hypothetical protein
MVYTFVVIESQAETAEGLKLLKSTHGLFVCAHLVEGTAGGPSVMATVLAPIPSSSLPVPHRRLEQAGT